MPLNDDLMSKSDAPLVFCDVDIYCVGQNQNLHGVDEHAIADVGDLCDSDCIDCD